MYHTDPKFQKAVKHLKSCKDRFDERGVSPKTSEAIGQVLGGIEKLEKALYPRPQLTGTYPVVLYLTSEKDRDEFIALVQQAKPEMKMESL